MPSREKDTYCIRSVENALHLLEALAEENSQSSLSELSQRLGMTKASLFRLMATFESHGYVERSQGSSEYRLGLAAFEVGQKLLSRMTLLRKARPVMEQMTRQCNETVYLVVQRDKEVLFLEMIETEQKVKVVPLVGRRFPMHSCAAGKIFLAYNKDNKALVDRHATSAKELENCKKLGAAIDQDGIGEGSTCIAVPLFNSESQLNGALALVGPSFRIDAQRTETELLPAIKAAGETISAQLGFLGYSLDADRADVDLNS